MIYHLISIIIVSYRIDIVKKRGGKMEYRKFRVKTTIKSFRDLEIYKRTTILCAELFNLKLPEAVANNTLEEEIKLLREMSKHVPEHIAESYGDRYTDRPLGAAKLEKAAQIVSNIITKLDLVNLMSEDKEFKEKVLKIIRDYQIQRRKILNLKRVWSGERSSGWKKILKEK
jgi:hypothetical protein